MLKIQIKLFSDCHLLIKENTQNCPRAVKPNVSLVLKYHQSL